MAAVESQPGVGNLLREWRVRRRLTQLELALDAGVSARHLSFVETGRSKPGRDLLLRVAEELGVPFRERNALLLAAGHAPAYPERSLDDPELGPVKHALDRILTAHEPYPAFAFDRSWTLVAANAGAVPLTAGLDPALLEPPVNVLRIGLALSDRMIDAGPAFAFIRDRVQRQVALTGDPELAALAAELGEQAARSGGATPTPGEVADPFRFRLPGGEELAFFGMFATFDGPFEVTTSELAIELLYPADRASAEKLARHDEGGR